MLQNPETPTILFNYMNKFVRLSSENKQGKNKLKNLKVEEFHLFYDEIQHAYKSICMYILCMYSLIVLKNSNELLHTHAKETRILITYVFLSQASTSLNSVLILSLLFFIVVELFHLCIVSFLSCF